MRVGLAAPSRTGLEALRRAVAETPHEITWAARSEAETLAQCRADLPDCLLLAVALDATGITRAVMQESPCAILLVGPPGEFVGRVYEAMGLGAVDVVAPPALDLDGNLTGGAALARRLETIEKLIAPRGPDPAPAPEPPAQPRVLPLVAIGTSTGGPQALATILGALPADLPAALVVVQHVDASFATGLASWLGERSGFAVELARPGERPRRATAYLAATADHLVLGDDGAFAHVAEPAGQIHRPSVDVLFRRLVTHPAPGMAILLTGMGRDGAEGLLALRRAGWTTVCQDERSAVVFGMPRAAIELGAAELVLPLDAIGGTITGFATRVSRAAR